MPREFKFINLDTKVLPNTKGKNIDGVRFYEIDGKSYPSVTSVLSLLKADSLKDWRTKVGDSVANWEMGRAARRGKAMHTLVEQYLQNQTPSIRDVLPLGLFKLIKPYVDKIDNVRMLETIMYSKKLTLAGQVDCVADYNGKLSVIDFKSANKEREEGWIENYFLQTTAYSMMYEELYGEKIEQLVVLLACEDGIAQCFIKNRADYEKKLLESIDNFYKQFNNKQNLILNNKK
jgi:genome maintenance exonuclease 1